MRLEEIQYSFKNLMSRSLRSWLTILSVLIGIMAIYAILSFGIGIQSYVNELSEEAGADKLFVQAAGGAAPGTDENFVITRAEVEFIDKVKGVDQVAGMYMKPAEIKFKKQIKYNWLVGFDPDDQDFIFESFGSVEIEKGRALKDGDMGKTVLGYNYQLADKIFRRPMDLGDKFEVNGVRLEVIGFASEVGNPGDDANIYVTDELYELLYPSFKDKYAMVMASAMPGADPDDVADEIEDELRKYRGLEKGEEDFYVQTFADILETFGSVLSILNSVLVLIALVSVVVAAVNIMNTMYTAVLERTKEIGIMKAIGARNSDILFIFVVESGLLGLVGGLIGVLFGYGIAKFGGYIAAISGYSSLQPGFPWWLTVGCFSFAFLVGAFSGLLPAIQASKLKPVDALRYE